MAKKTGEKRCRLVLERITKLKWPTVRPHWLVSPWSGRKLELDMYCAELGSAGYACEFDGSTHRKYQPGIIHPTREDFDKAQRLDIFKTQECKRLGVKLFRISDLEWRELEHDDPVVLKKILWTKMSQAQ